MTRELVNRWYLLPSRHPSLCKFSSCPVERKNEARLDRPPVEFPLTDSQGVYVEKDRRLLPDRRDPEHHTDDCLKAEAPIIGRHTARAVFFVHHVRRELALLSILHARRFAHGMEHSAFGSQEVGKEFEQYQPRGLHKYYQPLQ